MFWNVRADAQAGRCRAAARPSSDLPSSIDLARGRLAEARHAVEHRRLAGAVRPDQGMDRALLHVHAEAFSATRPPKRMVTSLMERSAHARLPSGRSAGWSLRARTRSQIPAARHEHDRQDRGSGRRRTPATPAGPLGAARSNSGRMPISTTPSTMPAIVPLPPTTTMVSTSTSVPDAEPSPDSRRTGTACTCRRRRRRKRPTARRPPPWCACTSMPEAAATCSLSRIAQKVAAELGARQIEGGSSTSARMTAITGNARAVGADAVAEDVRRARCAGRRGPR